MADGTANTDPLPPAPAKSHDGWKSRTLWVAAVAFLLPFAVVTFMVFWGKAEASLWADVVKWLGTTVPTTYGLANVGQRLAARTTQE